MLVILEMFQSLTRFCFRVKVCPHLPLRYKNVLFLFRKFH